MVDITHISKNSLEYLIIFKGKKGSETKGVRTPTLDKHRNLQINESTYVKLATSMLKQRCLLDKNHNSTSAFYDNIE